MLHERGGTEEEFAAADRNAQRDDAGPDGAQPAEACGTGWDWQLSELPVPIGLYIKTQNALSLEYRPLEVQLHRQLHEPSRQHRRRREPRAAGDERLVVAERRRRIQEVVEVHADVDAALSEAQDLAEPHVELVDTVAEHRVR